MIRKARFCKVTPQRHKFKLTNNESNISSAKVRNDHYCEMPNLLSCFQKNLCRPFLFDFDINLHYGRCIIPLDTRARFFKSPETLRAINFRVSQFPLYLKNGEDLSRQISKSFFFLLPLKHVKRSALQNKRLAVSQMAFRARKDGFRYF